VLSVTAVVAVTGQAQAGQTPPSSLLSLDASLPRRTVVLPILLYHRIDVLRPSLPGITRRLTVAPSEFRAQMEWLKGHGFHAVTQLQAFAALERGTPLPRKPVMITFDDGYRDVLLNASPVLKRLGMPATLYVITGRVSGPDPSFANWGELRVLEQRGITIGSHTVTHRPLTRLSSDEAQRELRDSRQALEQHLGHPVQWFAYPYGAEDSRIVTLAREAGYVLAVTTLGGSAQRADQPLLLRRLEILDSTSVSNLASLLAG
jgi:peptidoglycan/xylan/chitin deacetylase (PgdA/CDA1 family)